MAHGSTARNNSLGRYELSLANQQSGHLFDEKQLVDAARRVLADSKFTSAAVSLAIVDDPTIHDLNRRFLDHDYATDVLSFALEERDGHLEGEVVVSADTAARVAAGSGWTLAHELLLYVIHGMLHLVGLRDKTEAEAHQMRAAEQYYLQECGVDPPAQPRRPGESAPHSPDNGLGGTFAQ